MEDAASKAARLEQELEQARTESKDAESAHEADRTAVGELRAQVSTLQEQLAAARAQAAAAPASLQSPSAAAAAGGAAAAAAGSAVAAGRVQLQALSTAVRQAMQSAGYWRNRAGSAQLQQLAPLPAVVPAPTAPAQHTAAYVRRDVLRLQGRVRLARAARTPLRLSDADAEPRSAVQQAASSHFAASKLSTSLAQLRVQAHQLHPWVNVFNRKL